MGLPLIYSDSTFHNGPEGKVTLDECVEILRQAGAQVSLVERFHNKTLIVDDFILVEGSFNWFSASRSGAHVRQEHSICYAATEVAEIKQKTKSVSRNVMPGPRSNEAAKGPLLLSCTHIRFVLRPELCP